MIKDKILNFGIENYDKNEMMEAKLINVLFLTAMFGIFFFSLFSLFYLKSFFTFLFNIVSFSIYFFYFLFKKNGNLLRDKIYIFSVGLLLIFIATNFFYSIESGAHYYFLIISMCTYLFFNKEKFLKFFFIVLSFVLFFVSYFYNKELLLFDISKEALELSHLFNVVFLFIISNIIFAAVFNELEKKEERLKELSSTDFLTNILNRRAFYEKLRESIKFVKRYKQNSLGLIHFDVDLFKKINDKYGHDIGDLVLIELTKNIKKVIRDTDLFARVGGEEFIILLKNISKEELLSFSEKIRVLVEDLEVETSNNELIKFTISLGVTLYEEGDDVESFIKKADIATYESKKDGRNKVSSIF